VKLTAHHILAQIGNAPLNAIVFASYGHAMRVIKQRTEAGELGWLAAIPYGDTMLAGSWAGLLQCVVVAPTELVKCKLQVQGALPREQQIYSGPIDCFKKVCSPRAALRRRAVPSRLCACVRVCVCVLQMIQARGYLRGVFTGWWSTVGRDVISFVRERARSRMQ